ncbi:MAG: multidrug effflux MFS transporter [Pseudomonadota bacterium]
MKKGAHGIARAQEPKSADSHSNFIEFVMLMAVLMSMTALSIDIMLPALPDIRQAYDLADPNDQQLVVFAYMLGFGIGQPIFGPLSDSFGRKTVLMAGLGLYALASLAIAFSASFEALLFWRMAQGIFGAAPRVVGIAIIRDRYVGAAMARVMSFVMVVFIMVPVLAPALGLAVLKFTPWPGIFITLLILALITMGWGYLRLEETLAPEKRLTLRASTLADGIATVLSTRQTWGYTLAQGFTLTALMAYVASAQQIFGGIYGLGDSFVIFFGVVAFGMVVASFVNAQLVMRLGMRRVSHMALLLVLLTALATVLAAMAGVASLYVFTALMTLLFFGFGLIMANFNALAMQKVGHVAGMASSFVGFATTLIAVMGAFSISMFFDGTVLPFAMGLALFAGVALITVLLVEPAGGFAGADH